MPTRLNPNGVPSIKAMHKQSATNMANILSVTIFLNVSVLLPLTVPSSNSFSQLYVSSTSPLL